ncbi:diuretic hormone receptor-like protein [Dinothrombium tinctorium]|uniref:Diuretic hormone receptor-like protein n=1 Tax=Dinothrombium tinctorium TaxID=1965070 RepID=A0A3S3R3F1_9ACAR|nr:diuretic hormone receptor-like protein [Dinothrombium tinctorium]
MALLPSEYESFSAENETRNHLSYILVNKTIAEFNCYLSVYNESFHTMLTDGKQLICNGTWDGISCWPPTIADHLAYIPCFSEFNGIFYDITQNASRYCYANGSWAKSDYSKCSPLRPEVEIFQGLWGSREVSTLYCCGYGLSLIALIIALCIFLYFKDLRCVRNTIHINLMATFVLFELTWFLSSFLQPYKKGLVFDPSCFFFILLTYFLITNFFWMLVEGLYLYTLVVKTFSRELVNIHVYALIGWGLPMVIILIWVPVAYHFFQPTDQLTCPWHNNTTYSYIYQVPLLIVLLINIFFLIKIMWVLVTKLRATTNVESQQYRKAAKALLVLIPLLGVTHILFLVTPTSQMARIIVTYVQATFLSTQGLTVAVLYCFLNGERWKATRTVRGKEHTGNSRNTYVSRSLHCSEGMKKSRTREDRHRGSCISFTTTTTYVSNYPGGRDTGSGQRQVSNGSGNGYDPLNTQINEELL